MNEPTSPEQPQLSIREKYRGRIEKTLTHYLKNLDNGRLPRDDKGELRVLSVGCGFGYDVKPVLDSFPNSLYKGIDNNVGLISGARDLNLDVGGESVHFEVEDASQVDSSEAQAYGLVLIRHPQVLGTTIIGSGRKVDQGSIDIWREILKASAEKTKKSGFIFVTTDSEYEEEKILEYLQENGINVLVQELNRITEDSTGLPHTDLYVIVGKKE